MVLQCICPIEALAALFAAITTFATMNEPMLVVHRSGQETLVAKGAVIRPLASVALPNVILKIRTNGETPITAGFRACKRTNSIVEAQMLPQVAGLGVGFSAKLTQVRSRGRTWWTLGGRCRRVTLLRRLTTDPEIAWFLLAVNLRVVGEYRVGIIEARSANLTSHFQLIARLIFLHF